MNGKTEYEVTSKELSWWQIRSKLERLLLITTAFLISLILIGSISIITFILLKPSVCLSPTCIKASSKLLNAIDFRKHPCDNFFEFVCGNYINGMKIEKSSTDIAVLTRKAQRQYEEIFEEPLNSKDAKPSRNLKYLYNACMNETEIDKNGMDYMKRGLLKLGGWPVLEGKQWDESNFDWQTFTVKLRRFGYYHDIYISFNNHEDPYGTKRNYLKIVPPTVHGNEEPALRVYYAHYMASIAILFGADAKTAHLDMQHAYDFKAELFKLVKKHEQDGDKNITLITFDEANELSPQIDWYQFTNDLLFPMSLPDTDKIAFNATKYMNDLHKLLRKTSRRVQANYMLWETVKEMIPMLPSKLRDRAHEFAKLHSNATNRTKPAFTKRSTICIKEIKKIFPLVPERIYSDRYAPLLKKRKVAKMIHNIRAEFKDIIESNQWMDSETKKFALSKFAAAKEFIGGETKESREVLGKLPFAYIDLESSTNYIEAITMAKHAVTNFCFSIFNMSTEISGVLDLVTLSNYVNAYYSTNNYMIIPAAVLQDMIFNEAFPNYLNYGALGHVIGHELTHAFTKFSSNYGVNGEDVNWWSNSTYDNYENATQCLVDMYETHTNKKFGVKLNGTSTLDENIADITGVLVAYRAFKKVYSDKDNPLLPGLEHLTPSQLFWITNARFYCDPSEGAAQNISKLLEDHHGIASFRVIAPSSNLKEFAEDFGCKPGSVMNPVEKCIVF